MSDSTTLVDEEVESAPERATLVLLVLCGAQLLVALTITIVLVGGAAIKDSINVDDGDVHWLVTSYALAFGGLVLLSGRVGDTFGHRRMFLLGLGLFGLTSLGVAASDSTGQIVVARALQGVAAAMVSPATLALLTDCFIGTRQRARAFGAWSLAGSGGGVIGYLAGGAVVDSFGWRWAFAVNAPLALAGVVAGRALLPPTTNRRPAKGFDIAGAVTISGAAFALVYGFGRAQADGWLAVSTLGSIATAFVLTLLFLGVEARAKQPLIPIRLIKRRQFSANVVTLCSGATVSGTLLVASLFLQEERGYSARDAGFSTLPVPIGVAIGAKLTSTLMRRKPGSRGIGIAVTGQLLTASGYAFAAVRITSDDYVTSFLPAWLLMGLGLSMSSIPMVSFATSDVGPNDRGIVSGIFNMAQQLGSALGVAALWTVTHSARSGREGASAAVEAARAGFAVATVIALANAAFTAVVVSGRIRGRRDDRQPSYAELVL